MILQLVPGDVFGYLALAFVIGTAVLMLLRRILLRHTKNLEGLRQIHLWIATLGGCFLVLHAFYFISYPMNEEIALGYVSASVALFVWLTGTAFLERLRDSLFFHGSMSLTAIGLMIVHAAGSGTNLPAWIAEGILIVTAGVVFWRVSLHVERAVTKR